MSSKDVLREFDNALCVFSGILKEKKYLFGERLSEIDCLLFGHLYAILTTKYMGTFGGDLQQTIAKYQNLIDHTKEIDRKGFVMLLRRYCVATRRYISKFNFDAKLSFSNAKNPL